MSKPKYQIGDTAFTAEANSWAEVEVPCPICFGHRRVTLTLGNGEALHMDCEACNVGYQGPSGVVRDWQTRSSTRSVIVTGVEQYRDHDEDDSPIKWRYMLDVNATVKEADLYSTRDEAETRRVVMHAEAEQDAKRRNESNMLSKARRHSWSASYARAEIKEARRKIAYHEGRMQEVSERAGEETKP
jgi:hypothetical protein